MIGLSYVPDFVDARPAHLRRVCSTTSTTSVEVAGIEAVGLGGDFDGGGDLLADATRGARHHGGAARRGYAEEAIRKILGGNTLRVLEQAIG